MQAPCMVTHAVPRQSAPTCGYCGGEVVIRVIFGQDVHVTNTDGLMLQQQLPRTVAISAHKRGQLVQRHRLCV